LIVAAGTQHSRFKRIRRKVLVGAGVCAATGVIATLLLSPWLMKLYDDRNGWTIQGTVYSKENIVESYMLVGYQGPEDLDSIDGATVLLARDEAGMDVVPGTRTATDREGNYSIFVKKGGHYHLIVERAGYARLVTFVGIGPMGIPDKNEVILKKLKNEGPARP
jgi:hypothetical protein